MQRAPRQRGVRGDGPARRGLPGNDAIDIAADDFCYDEFTAFVGIAWDDSTLDYFPLTPLEEGWNQLDDRQVLCFVFDGEGGVVGTLKDAAR